MDDGPEQAVIHLPAQNGGQHSPDAPKDPTSTATTTRLAITAHSVTPRSVDGSKAESLPR